MLVDLLSIRMTKRHDASDVSFSGRRDQIDRQFREPVKACFHQRIGSSGNVGNTRVANVIQTRADRIDSRIVGHADGEAGCAWFADRFLKSIRAERIIQIEPAAGRYGPFGRAPRGNSDKSATVRSQNPLVSAADNQIGFRKIERNTSQSLSDIHRQQGRGVCSNRVGDFRQRNFMAVEEAHQRRVHQPRLWAKQRDQIFNMQRPVAGSPDLHSGGALFLQPWRGTGRKVQVVDDHFIAVLQAKSHRGQIVRF